MSRFAFRCQLMLFTWFIFFFVRLSQLLARSIASHGMQSNPISVRFFASPTGYPVVRSEKSAPTYFFKLAVCRSVEKAPLRNNEFFSRFANQSPGCFQDRRRNKQTNTFLLLPQGSNIHFPPLPVRSLRGIFLQSHGSRRPVFFFFKRTICL